MRHKLNEHFDIDEEYLAIYPLDDASAEQEDELWEGIIRDEAFVDALILYFRGDTDRTCVEDRFLSATLKEKR